MNKLTSSARHKPMDFFAKWGTIATIVVMFTFFSVHLWGMFFTQSNLLSILRSASITTVIAIGMTFAVAAGGMDLSLGAIAGFSMNLVAMCFIWWQMNTFFALIITLTISSLLGFINAFLIVRFKIPDMLATLAVQFMINGIAITMAGGGSITEGVVRSNGLPAQGKMEPIFRAMGRAPTIVIIMLVVVVLALLFFKFHKFGRYIYVVGENIGAAKLSGINVNKFRTMAYVASSFCAALGGILLAARLGSAQLNAGDGYLMPSVAATFIGLSVAGAGKANPLGTMLGALLMSIMENGLIMEAVPYYSVNIFKGIVLAIALTLAFIGNKDSSK